MRFPCICCAALVLGCVIGDAWSGGFVDGDIYLVSKGLPDPNDPAQPCDGVMHIDPQTGSTTRLPYDPGTAAFAARSTYDPFRDRIISFINLTSTVVVQIDSDGNSTDLSFSWLPRPIRFAPTGDGRIYMVDEGGEFGFIDAADAAHDLLDESGADRFSFGPAGLGDVGVLMYDAVTNSLFSADGQGDQINVHKIPLTPDGSQVAGPVVSVAGVLSGFFIKAVGWSRGPDGKLLLKVDDNTNNTLPRMLTVAPTSMTVAPFAQSGYFGVAGETAGTYSHLLGQVVVLDTGNDVLRRFDSGESGAGAPWSGGVSSTSGSGEDAQLIVIGGTVNTPTPIPGDLDGSGTVDVVDLLALLAAWGPCPGCPADFDGNDAVDVVDLLALLANWS